VIFISAFVVVAIVSLPSFPLPIVIVSPLL
jgi:hypothetical protein